MRISDWSSDVCSSDLPVEAVALPFDIAAWAAFGCGVDGDLVASVILEEDVGEAAALAAFPGISVGNASFFFFLVAKPLLGGAGNMLETGLHELGIGADHLQAFQIGRAHV